MGKLLCTRQEVSHPLQEVSPLNRGNLLQAKFERFLELLQIVNIIFYSKLLPGSFIFDIESTSTAIDEAPKLHVVSGAGRRLSESMSESSLLD